MQFPIEHLDQTQAFNLFESEETCLGIRVPQSQFSIALIVDFYFFPRISLRTYALLSRDRDRSAHAISNYRSDTDETERVF
jgi:hypothetical protein